MTEIRAITSSLFRTHSHYEFAASPTRVLHLAHRAFMLSLDILRNCCRYTPTLDTSLAPHRRFFCTNTLLASNGIKILCTFNIIRCQIKIRFFLTYHVFYADRRHNMQIIPSYILYTNKHMTQIHVHFQGEKTTFFIFSTSRTRCLIKKNCLRSH